MAIVYRTAGAWGGGKGSNLTAAEVDSNFYDLHGRVDTLESGSMAPAEIDDITVLGREITITLTDARSFGPFDLPRTYFSWRGEWAPTTNYYSNDVVSVAGDGIYESAPLITPLPRQTFATTSAKTNRG